MYKQAIVNNLIKLAKINTLNATGATIGAGIGGTAGYFGSNALSKYIGLKGGGKENDFLHKRLGIDPNSKYRKYGDITLRTLGTIGGAAGGAYGGYVGGDALHNKLYGGSTNVSAPVDVDYSDVDLGINGAGVLTKGYSADYPNIDYLGASRPSKFENERRADGIRTKSEYPNITVQRVGKNGERYNIDIGATANGNTDLVGRNTRASYVLGGNIADLTEEKKKQLASIINGLSTEYKNKKNALPGIFGNEDYVSDMRKIFDGDTLDEHYIKNSGDATPEQRQQLADKAFDILTARYGNTPLSDDPNSIDNIVFNMLNGDKPGIIGLGSTWNLHPDLAKKYYGDNTYFEDF